MFEFLKSGFARANLHQQKRALKLCSATLKRCRVTAGRLSSEVTSLMSA